MINEHPIDFKGVKYLYTIVVILLIAAIILFILSFFQKNGTEQVHQEVEELSMQFFQESYKLKKRLKVLEEELLGGEPFVSKTDLQHKKNKPINEILKSQVLALFNQGLSFEQIAKQSALSVDEVQSIIASNAK